MKKLFTTIPLVFLLAVVAFSQNFKEQYKAVAQTKDFAKQKQIIDKWEKANPNDPELYVAYFNHYISKSRQEVLSLSRNKSGDKSVELTDEKTGKTVGSLSSQIVFDEENFNLAIQYIDKGISKFPNRLDMRFGKTYMLGQRRDFENFTNEIIKTIEHSNQNKNKWLWMDGEMIDEPQKFMLASIQDYIVQLYNAGDEYGTNIKNIAETVLKYYPNNVENLSNLSIHYLIKEDYKNALIYLLKAEKVAPKDAIVLSNIAWSYYKTGDKQNAIKYYELAYKFGSGKLKAGAKQQRDKLKGK